GEGSLYPELSPGKSGLTKTEATASPRVRRAARTTQSAGVAASPPWEFPFRDGIAETDAPEGTEPFLRDTGEELDDLLHDPAVDGFIVRACLVRDEHSRVS